MTSIYFVRHAQPDHGWEEDRTRPLTNEGKTDSEKVYEALKDIRFDYIISSPYKRSVDTIKHCADSQGVPIITDERLKERIKGRNGNNYGMFQKRWADFSYHEDGGESLGMTQNRVVDI